VKHKLRKKKRAPSAATNSRLVAVEKYLLWRALAQYGLMLYFE
jgi:hypothetical protein